MRGTAGQAIGNGCRHRIASQFNADQILSAPLKTRCPGPTGELSPQSTRQGVISLGRLAIHWLRNLAQYVASCLFDLLGRNEETLNGWWMGGGWVVDSP